MRFLQYSQSNKIPYYAIHPIPNGKLHIQSVIVIGFINSVSKSMTGEILNLISVQVRVLDVQLFRLIVNETIELAYEVFNM